MTDITVNQRSLAAEIGETLSAVLVRHGIRLAHPCGGRGVCRKCTVSVDGVLVLSCQYRIRGGETVLTNLPGDIAASSVDAVEDALLPVDPTLVLDIGTTTLAMALIDAADNRGLRVLTADNPQRVFGADVMSRIARAAEAGVGEQTALLHDQINKMIGEIGSDTYEHLYVVGNTVMLHIFWGVDPSPLGVAPYTPAFLEEKRAPAADYNIRGVREIVSLPSFATFAGADIVAGLYEVARGDIGADHRLLIDLGTNAEIVLYNDKHIFCTSAAAGPCFEGADISCGMSATEGAISHWDPDGSFETIKKAPPRGLCGTGLVDAVAGLLDRGIITPDGGMACGRFYLAEGVALTAADVRAFQLAKAAVRAAIDALLARAHIREEDISAVFIAGGFAASLRPERAVRAGLLPAAWSGRCRAVGNSALGGAIRYAACVGSADLRTYTDRACYIDLADDPTFSKNFIRHMNF